MFSGLSSILTTKVEIEKIAREPGELRTLVKELVVHAARADQVKTRLKEANSAFYFPACVGENN